MSLSSLRPVSPLPALSVEAAEHCPTSPRVFIFLSPLVLPRYGSGAGAGAGLSPERGRRGGAGPAYPLPLWVPGARREAAWLPAWSWVSRRRRRARAVPGGCAAPTSPARSGGGRRGWARPGCRAPALCAANAASSPAPSCSSCTRRCPAAPTPSTAPSSCSPAAAPPVTAWRARAGPSAVRRRDAGRDGARAAGSGPADRRVSPAVFRNQLPRRNDTYPEEPPPEEPPPGPAPAPPQRLGSGAALCRVCGCLGPRCCGRCRRAAYCGPEHQALDWRRGHRRSCGQPAAGGGSAANRVLWNGGNSTRVPACG